MNSKNNERPLEGRVTLVTGASRGIGYATAIALAKAGSHIISTGRTQGGLEDLDDAIRKNDGESTIVPMDFRQPDGFDQLGEAIYKRWGRLDGFLSCAGLLGEMAPVPHLDPKTFEDTMAVNVTSNYRLIRSLDPLLRVSPSGRALFISSMSAQTRKAFWGLYAASKSALDALIQSYAAETEKTNMRINLLYPGPVRTQMRAKAYPGEDPDTLPMPKDIAGKIVPMLSPSWKSHGEIISFRKD